MMFMPSVFDHMMNDDFFNFGFNAPASRTTCNLMETDVKEKEKSYELQISLPGVKKEDIKSTLLEPLYYTFKTKSSRYKSSQFSVLDEVDDHIHSLSGESVIHYILWSLLAIVMIAELCLLSPQLFG